MSCVLVLSLPPLLFFFSHPLLFSVETVVGSERTDPRGVGPLLLSVHCELPGANPTSRAGPEAGCPTLSQYPSPPVLHPHSSWLWPNCTTWALKDPASFASPHLLCLLDWLGCSVSSSGELLKTRGLLVLGSLQALRPHCGFEHSFPRSLFSCSFCHPPPIPPSEILSPENVPRGSRDSGREAALLTAGGSGTRKPWRPRGTLSDSSKRPVTPLPLPHPLHSLGFGKGGREPIVEAFCVQEQAQTS